MARQHCEYTECHRTVHFKMVDFMLCEFSPNKLFFKDELLCYVSFTTIKKCKQQQKKKSLHLLTPRKQPWACIQKAEALLCASTS